MREQIDQAAAFVRRGGVILYPTQTVYGLGGDPRRPETVERIRRLKNRPAGKPMLIITDTWERVEPWITNVSSLHRQLMAQIPPMAVTLLFESAAEELSAVRGSAPLLGIRCTGDSFCRAVIQKANCPLISTSANPSGQPAPRTFQEVDQKLLQAVDLAVDAGHPLTGTSSTVVAVKEGRLKVLREGAVSVEQLKKITATDLSN